MHLAERVLVVSGLLGLLIGFLCGFPLRRAITSMGGEEAVRGWRVAHSSLVNGGVMLLAIAGVWSHLALGTELQALASITLSTSLFAFSYALVVGAWRGHRGLVSEGDGLARSIYYGNTLGAVLSTIGLVATIAGALIGLCAAF